MHRHAIIQGELDELLQRRYPDGQDVIGDYFARKNTGIAGQQHFGFMAGLDRPFGEQKSKPRAGQLRPRLLGPCT